MRPGFERLMVGRLLAGRYEVLEAIGRGGMSLVFRGLDTTLGREVAVKIVSLAESPDQVLPNLRERFRREAASAARIQHPNVVGIFDYGTDPELELDFIIMELLTGRDLKEELRRNPVLPQPEALRILMDAARGVAAGHRAGIIHRDVKPANIFLAGKDEIEAVRILDFGIAKPLGDDPEHALTTIGHLPHSPAYASPEQIVGTTQLTASSDVYQLGLIGYELLAGQRPYNEHERNRVRAGEEVPLPRTPAWTSVSPALCDVIQTALRLNPDERHPEAAAFIEALAAAQSDDGTAFHPGSSPPAAEEAPGLVPAPAATALLSGAAGVPVIAPSVAPPGVGHPADGLEPGGVPASQPARRFAIPGTPVMWIVPLLLLLAVAVWASRRGGSDSPAVAAVAPDSGQLAALDGEFLKLQGAVGARAVAEAPPPQPAGDAPATTPGTPASDADVLARAKAEIEANVRALNAAWVDGDVREHVRYYGSRVDYYNSRRLPRSGVYRDRRRDADRYDSRSITAHSINVQFLEPDRARVLMDKEWVFGGDGQTRRGRGMQEYIFKRDEDDGKWYVVSEQLLTRNEENSR
ncbi:MAG: protein kinase [Gemmatimonadetes bacterium]|nr:protein kinase [Gemmatimonadota bacterium]